jgi:hypothetical protein
MLSFLFLKVKNRCNKKFKLSMITVVMKYDITGSHPINSVQHFNSRMDPNKP